MTRLISSRGREAPALAEVPRARRFVHWTIQRGKRAKKEGLAKRVARGRQVEPARLPVTAAEVRRESSDRAAPYPSRTGWRQSGTH